MPTVAGHAGDDREPPRAPARVRSATQVNVAFPFAKFISREPNAELLEMAAILVDLTQLVGEIAPGPESARMRARALAVMRTLTER